MVARTVVYDRAGLGKSDLSPHPRTVEVLASELHFLLLTGKVPSPYILIGHSFGGAIVQVFAHFCAFEPSPRSKHIRKEVLSSFIPNLFYPRQQKSIRI